MSHPDGTPIWFELITPDPDTAQNFYQAVAGWRIAPSSMPEHGGYRIAVAQGDEDVAGLMAPPPGTGGAPGWTIYFAAGDVDAMAARVKEFGGQVFFGPMDIPHVGRFATLGDPQGVVFSIIKGSSPQQSTAFKPMRGEAGHGHGVWVELASPDPDGALAFYGALFGWSKQGAMPMGEMGEYAFIGRGEQDRPGAIMSSTTTGAPARWNWYVQVPDIDAAVASAKGEGGELLQGPDPIPGGGFSANVKDAQGFQVGIVGARKP